MKNSNRRRLIITLLGVVVVTALVVVYFVKKNSSKSDEEEEVAPVDTTGVSTGFDSRSRHKLQLAQGGLASFDSSEETQFAGATKPPIVLCAGASEDGFILGLSTTF